MEFYATCPTGFEPLLSSELKGLGVARVRPLQGQVAFEDDLAAAYRACLWSRLASRVVAVLARGNAASSDELYDTASTVCWENHIGAGTTFAVDASGTNAQLKNTQFSSLRIKDALVDRIFSHTGARPQANPKSPDVGVVARIVGSRVTLGIDLAGAPLFRRGYERSHALRGLRPDYAAALLALGRWHDACRMAEAALLDASPDPSTLVVEAALQAAGHAPGLLRVRWGFARWGMHDEETWAKLLQEARQAAQDTTSCRLMVLPHASHRAGSLRSMLRSAGLDARIQVTAAEPPQTDLLACDLSALGSDDIPQEAVALSRLATSSRGITTGAIVVAARDQLATPSLGRTPSSTMRSTLGKDPLLLCRYEGAEPPQDLGVVALGAGRKVPVLVPSSDQFATRLHKVARQRAKWARREDVSCYRLYDADLPDYALTIDLFQGTDPSTGALTNDRWLWVSEYAAPKQVDPSLARSRLMDALALAPALLGVSPRNTFLRVRRHDKGGSQYASEGQRRASGGTRMRAGSLPPGAHLIEEGGLTFEVNFSTRLDCGIFLDHRDTRAMLREMAKQTQGSKRFLNLFAYTGTATCYAADGGARHTTTVDLSRPSLDWARRNMERNGFVGREHEYVQADVVRWVGEQRHTRNRWDLVFCDVPTFSNSSRMGKRSFDVQRDHAELLIGVSRLLTRNGTCVFSCNLRSFSPDVDKLAKAGVTIEDITDDTIPEDFARNRRVHHAYVVRRTPLE